MTMSQRGLVLPSLGLVAVLALVVRPAVASLSTVRTDLTGRERAFLGWMAPRELVVTRSFHRPQVEVDPVLDLLRLWHLDEQQAMRPIARVDRASYWSVGPQRADKQQYQTLPQVGCGETKAG